MEGTAKPKRDTNAALKRRRAEARARREVERGRATAAKLENDETLAALASTLPATPPLRALGGEPTKYSPAIAAEICQRLASGETVNRICETDGYPNPRTFRQWVVSYPELRDAWNAARKVKANSLFDEALDIARDLKEGRKSVSSNEVNALRVAIETLKWAASKLDPGQYGEQAGKVPAVAIQINTSLDLGRAPSADGDESLYSFTVQLPKPLDPSTGAEQPRVPVSKRKGRAAGSASEGDENGA